MSDEHLLGAFAALGLELPGHCAPRGRFLPWTRSGRTVYLAGQICEWNGEVLYHGSVGASVSIDDGIKAAQVCALNLLFHLRAACGGDLARVTRCLRLGAFVNAPPGFPHSPKIANGASDVLIALWGEAGRHARTAIGVSALPMDASVEVDAIFEAEED
jgi:enamine deaminase RidA (YjgF/YER057c/UK114 family)